MNMLTMSVTNITETISLIAKLPKKDVCITLFLMISLKFKTSFTINYLPY